MKLSVLKSLLLTATLMLTASAAWADETVKMTFTGSPNADWSTTWYDIDTAAIARGLGVSPADLTTLYHKDIFVYSDAGNGNLQDSRYGSAYAGDNGQYKGSWMNKDGLAIGFNADNCYYFYIINESTRQIGMGQYPNRLKAGDTYNFKLLVQLRPDSGQVKQTVTLDITYQMSYEGPYKEALSQLNQLLVDKRLENIPDDLRAQYEALAHMDMPATEEGMKEAIDKINAAIADLQGRMHPEADTTYTFETKPATDYSSTWYAIDTRAMAEKLGLTQQSLEQYYNTNNVTYNAYDENFNLVSNVEGATAYTGPTADDSVKYVGFWFDANGHPVGYGSNSIYFINFDPKGRLACGQYPGKVTVNSSYKAYLAFENVQNGKRYVVLVNYVCTNKLVYQDLLKEAQQALNDAAYADANPQLRQQIQEMVDAGMPADGNYDAAVEKLRQLLLDLRSGSQNIINYSITDVGMRNNSDAGGYERRYFHIPMDQVAQKLDIPADSIASLFKADNTGRLTLATYDSLYNKVTTFGAWGDGYSGYWVNRKGFKCDWGDDAYVFFVFNPDSSSVGIGQYPQRVMPAADLSFYMIFTYTKSDSTAKSVALKIHYTTDNHITLSENDSTVMTGTVLRGVIPTVKKQFLNDWSSLVLPFPVSKADFVSNFGEGARLLRLVGKSSSEGYVYFTPADSMKANTPYLIYLENTVPQLTLSHPVDINFGSDPSAHTDSASFIGTYTVISAPVNSKVMDGDNVFYNNYDPDTKLKAYSAYLTYTWNATEDQGDVELEEITNEQADALGIRNVKAGNMQSGRMYDLSGREVTRPAKGVYIMNGKKFIVR